MKTTRQKEDRSRKIDRRASVRDPRGSELNNNITSDNNRPKALKRVLGSQRKRLNDECEHQGAAVIIRRLLGVDEAINGRCLEEDDKESRSGTALASTGVIEVQGRIDE